MSVLSRGFNNPRCRNLQPIIAKCNPNVSNFFRFRNHCKNKTSKASPALCQKPLRTGCPTLSSLQFCHSLLTDQVTLVNVCKYANTGTAECSVPHLNAYVGQTGRQLSTRVEEYKGDVRRQLKILYSPTLPEDRPSIRLG